MFPIHGASEVSGTRAEKSRFKTEDFNRIIVTNEAFLFLKKNSDDESFPGQVEPKCNL